MHEKQKKEREGSQFTLTFTLKSGLKIPSVHRHRSSKILRPYIIRARPQNYFIALNAAS